MSQHLIFGAGLIGGYMAGCFAAKGLKVTVLGREVMRKRFAGSLRITDYHKHQADVSAINFIADKHETDIEFDYLWLTVKCTGLEQALSDMTEFVSSKTVILSCQNGLGSDALVQTAFPDNIVRRVIMTSNVAQQSDTHLHRGSEGDLFIEAHSSDASGDLVGDDLERHDSLASLVSSPLLVAQNIDDMQAYSWAKLQINLANAVNALADIPVKQMLQHRLYRKIIALTMNELLQVTYAKGLVLPKIAAVAMPIIPKILNTPNFIFSIIGSKMMNIDPTVRTSMWWDLHNKRLSEVDFLNGAIVAEGKRLGINCPANQQIVDYVHAVEASDTREPFAPEKFLENLTN